MKKLLYGILVPVLFLSSASLAFASVTINSVTLNGSSAPIHVQPGDNITVALTATLTDGSKWKGIDWGISNNGSTGTCVNTKNAKDGTRNNATGVFTETFTIKAPAGPGLYNSNFSTDYGNNCGQPSVTSPYVISNSVVVGSNTNPPVIQAHDDITVQLTGNATGAVVTYTNPSAADHFGNTIPVTCTPASGSTFPVGDTLITCTAHDAWGNNASPSLFHVSVLPPVPTDVTPPSVVSFTPELGSTTVALNTPISITFNEPLATSSVTSSAVQLHHALNFDSSSPSFGPDFQLNASVSLSADGMTVTITPIDQMQYATQYYLLVVGGVSTAITDLVGNQPAHNLLDSNNAIFTTVTAPAN